MTHIADHELEGRVVSSDNIDPNRMIRSRQNYDAVCMRNIIMQSLKVRFASSCTPNANGIPFATRSYGDVVLLEKDRRKGQLAVIINPFRKYPLLLLFI